MTKNRICELRKAEGMSQKELGDKLGVAQTTVSAWEVGRNEPDAASIKKMAELFEASMEYVMGYGERSYRRGLTEEDFHRIVERRELEKSMKGDEEAEEYERTGMTKEELEEWVEEDLRSEWEETHPDIYFETYVIETLFDNMTEVQRNQGRRMMEAYAEGIKNARGENKTGK